EVLVECRRVAVPVEDRVVQVIGHLDEVHHVDFVPLRSHCEAVDEGVIGVAIWAQQELSLRAAPRHHAGGAWVDGTRERHGTPTHCTCIANDNRADSHGRDTTNVRLSNNASDKAPDGGHREISISQPPLDRPATSVGLLGGCRNATAITALTVVAT